MKDKDGPQRRCIVTRETRPPEDLIRFVVGPDGALVPDVRRKLPGRGVWVMAHAQAVSEAIRRKAFARALKAPVTVPQDLADQVDRLIERDALQALSLCRKAGAVVTGFGKVESTLASGKAVALIHAREAAEDGVRKLGQTLRRTQAESRSGDVALIRDFAGADLDLALGGSHVIHAALVAGPAGAGFLARWRRLVEFRGSVPAVEAGADAVTPAAAQHDGHSSDQE